MNRSVPARDRVTRTSASFRAPGYSRALPRNRGLARGVAADSGECDQVGQLAAIARAFLAGGVLVRPNSVRRDVGRPWRNAGYRGGRLQQSLAGAKPMRRAQMGAGGLR